MDPARSTPHLTTADVRQRYKISDMTLGRWVADRGFPRPMRIGRRTYWRLADIEAFEASLQHGVAPRPGRAA